MNIFNVPEGFWEEHALLYATLIMSLGFNAASLVGLLVVLVETHYERKAKERIDMVEHIVKRVKREMKQEEREKK